MYLLLGGNISSQIIISQGLKIASQLYNWHNLILIKHKKNVLISKNYELKCIGARFLLGISGLRKHRNFATKISSQNQNFRKFPLVNSVDELTYFFLAWWYKLKYSSGSSCFLVLDSILVKIVVLQKLYLHTRWLLTT